MTIMLAATCQRSLLGPFTATVALCDLLSRWMLILPLIDVEKEVEALAQGHRARTRTYSAEIQGPRNIGATVGPESGGSTASRGPLSYFSWIRLSVG